MNVWTGVGRLVKDCETKKTNEGMSVCTFTLAVKKDERVKDGDKDAWFMDCVAWAKKADYLGSFAKKGDAVSVTGALRFKEYNSKEGERVKTVECICDRVQIVFKYAKEQHGMVDTKTARAVDNMFGLNGVPNVVSGDDLPF